MDIEELRIRVREINKGLNNPYEFGEGYKRCKKFIQKNNYTKNFNFDDIDIIEAVKCVYFVQYKGKKTMDECNKFIDSFVPFFLVSEDDIENLIVFFELISLCKISNELIKYINEKDNDSANGMIYKIIFSNKKIIKCIDEYNIESFINSFKYFRELNKFVNIENLFNSYCENNEIFNNIIFMTKTFELYNCKKDMQKAISILNKIDMDQITNFLDASMINEESIKNRIGRLYSQLDKINSYIWCENHKSEVYNKKRKKIQKQNLTALNLLETAINKKEINNIRDIIYYISDDDLKKDFLRVIYTHNKKYYSELATQFNDVKKNSVNAYIMLFKEYELEIGIETIKKLMSKSVDNIREMLSFLKQKYNLTTKDIIYIIEVSNIDILREIDKFVSDGYLNYEFVFNNKFICDSNSNHLNIIKNNISAINAKGINPKIFSSNCKLFLSENIDLVIKNIDILTEYALIKKLKYASDYSFLLELNLEEKIDKFIEFGYINFLSEKLDLLNCINISRLEILHKMNYEINDLEQLIQILNTKKFNFIDEKIDEYIFNIVDYMKKEELILSDKQLNNKRINYWTYSFDGVYVSALKVNRLLNSGFDVYDAIFYNMNLTVEEYNTIINDICPKQLIKKQE